MDTEAQLCTLSIPYISGRNGLRKRLSNRYWNQSNANVPDTNTRIDAKSPTADRPNDTAKALTPIGADSATSHHGPSRFFDIDSDGSSDDLDGFVSYVITTAQSQCKHVTDYADIEALAVLVRVFIIEKINGWDETALHDYLRAKSLRRGLGFETLLSQSGPPCSPDS